MESKRLPFSEHLKATIIQPDEVDIEVPAGESHYHVEQTNGERTHTLHLRHPGTIVRISGIVTTKDASNLATTIIHHAPHTKAETLIRTLGTGKSQSTFRGLIKIEEDAAGCESYLNHHSLLFDDARSWTWPALEIGNNEVKCSHAATVKTITPLDLFYARSRGIPTDEAKKIMIEAFFSDVQI